MEIMMLSGLVLIAVSWVWQALNILRGKRELRLDFVGVYSLGVALIVISTMSVAVTMVGLFQLISLITALFALVALLKK